MSVLDTKTRLKIRAITKANYVVKHWGLTNVALRIARRFEISSLQNYVLYRLWGFDETGEEYEYPEVFVDPNEIVYTHQFPFHVRGDDAVVGVGSGTWHRCVRLFDQSLLSEALHDRFVEGKDWEETKKYREVMERVKRGEKIWNGCTRPEEVDQRCELLDELYYSMKENGYLSQADLRATSHHKYENHYYRDANGVRFPDEIRIAIGPDGQLIRVEGGRHRLAIAKLLGIDEIPVVVQIVHERFAEANRDPLRTADRDETSVGREWTNDSLVRPERGSS